MNLPESGSSAQVGTSHEGRGIVVHAFGAGAIPVLLLGGVHGDETEGVLFAERMLEEIRAGRIHIEPGIKLYISPRVNPDGCTFERRTNHKNVDLNRNLPTKDWTGEFTNPRYYPGPAAGSEPESIATIRMIETIRPRFICSLHSWENPMINYNGDCIEVARAMAEKNGLPPKGDIGYPTPGSLGTYTGLERKIPTITLEILRGEDPQTVWHKHREAVLAGLHFYAGKSPRDQARH